MSAQQNSFSNDGSFLAHFLQMQQAGPGDAAAHTDGAEDNTQTAQPAAGTDGSAQQAGDYSQYYADYAAYYGGYGAYGYGYPGYGQPAQQMQPQGMGGGGYGGGGGYQNRPSQPSRSLWVGNVHPDTAEQELHAIFQQFGPIESIKVIVHKGCAFVGFVELESAIDAYNNLSHHRPYLRGQELRIGWGKADTREHTRRETRDDDTGPRSKNLWIGGLGPDVFEEDVRDKFSPYGRIEHIKLLPDKKCGFVNFDNVESAVRAKRELQGQYIRGRPIKINYGRIEGDERARSAPPPVATGAPSPSPPPPPPAQPPADSSIKTVIDKMAEYVARNGSAFERMVREREKNNPKLQFLFEGNEHNPYYEWKLYTLVGSSDSGSGGGGGGGMPHAPPQAESYQDQMPAAPSGPLSPQDRLQLHSLLDALDGTKDPIMAGKDWIFQHWAQAGHIADELRAYVERAADWTKKLASLYLVNDVLHHALAQRTDVNSVDTVSDAFKLPSVFMFRAAYHGQTPDKQEKITQLLRLWENRHIYGAATIQRMEQAILSPTPPAEPPHTLNTTGVPPPNPMTSQPQLPYGYSQQMYQQMGYGAQQQPSMSPQQQSYNAQPYNYGQQAQDASRKRRRSPSPERDRGYDREDRGRDRDRDRDYRDREDRGRDRDRRERKSGWDA